MPPCPQWTPEAIRALRGGKDRHRWAIRNGFSPSTVKKWENGQRKPSPRACLMLDRLWARQQESTDPTAQHALSAS